MTEKNSCPDNKFFFSFLTILIILLTSVYCITVISAKGYTPSGEEDTLQTHDASDTKAENFVSATSKDEVVMAEENEIVFFPLVGNITSLYAFRIDPFYDPASGEQPTYEFHHGIDISAAQSRDIMACADGVVSYTGYDSGYGNHIIIEHVDFVSLYAHCDSFFVSSGQVVEAGEIIAIAGSTGRSTGPHLHFEIRVNGECVDPLDFVGCVYTGTIY